MPKITNPKCHFCEGAEARATLAEALRSGNYAEQPEPWEANLLRDNEDRYTVTGVAASAVSPCAWASLDGQWHAVWLDELTYALPHRKSHGPEITDLNDEEAHALISTGGGESRGCPEITACTLGMWDESQHSGILSATAAALTHDQKIGLGIPPETVGDWPLDRMTFEAAAQLVTLHSHALGGCHCP